MLIVRSPIIVALDFPEWHVALAFAKTLDPALVRLKVGKELFVAEGPKVVDELHALGFDVFLDLKFHDIPNTVAKACVSSAKLGVWMMNVHASGGAPMMMKVVEALASLPKRPLLTAVTVLTSMDQSTLASLGISRDIEEQVLHLAQLTQQNGLDGVVCSAQEAKYLRQRLGDDFLLVTPGIRLATDNEDDQHRIVTPEQAITNGADYLVIGRPITRAVDPQQVIETIINRIA